LGLNENDQSISLAIEYGESSFSVAVPARAAITCIWKP